MDYNEIINYILNDDKIQKLKEKYEKEKEVQNEIKFELRRLEIYLIEKVGRLFDELKIDELESPNFHMIKHGHNYYGIVYTLWYISGENFNPKKDIILLSNKKENIVDFSNLQLIKDIYNRMGLKIKEKYKTDIENIIYENDKKQSFYNMVLKKVEKW